ncbi:MAG TPA: hypothetical protein PK400_05735 [Phycisphaerales bacterium]|nr:hypothetical protein [Phycisphaerales bacterium]HRQ76317.1 hypothetical protein [Phycisphaerales bacterium]
MPRIGTIIFLLWIAWMVVSAIINLKAEKKKQEREAELAKMRRAQIAGGQGDSPSNASAGTSEGGTRLDDVIARRKAQLEELRAQRTARKGSQPVSSEARLPPGQQQILIPGKTPPTIGRTPQQTPTRSGGLFGTASPQDRGPARAQQAEATRARQEAQRRAREAQEQRKRAEEARVAAEQRTKLARQQAEAAARRSEEKAAAVERISAPRKQTTSFRAMLSSPRSLRQAILLKELLDKPVSLR